MTAPADPRLEARSDLAWAITVGGIGVILFAATLAFSWYYAAALFLLFSGMLLGVALNAMTSLLGRVLPWPHPLRLALVCLTLAALLVGIVFLGGTTIADQAKVLSDTIKSQLGNIKGFLDRNGIDTSFFDFSAATQATSAPDGGSTTPTQAPSHSLPGGLPSPSALASSGGAIVSQTFKLLLGTVSAVGNFFIVLFLG
ncbi:MAG: AI-2E family transporter, partial [Bradyrhizobium sp.]|nr:AI-2E family transporter [Bradyrhizobium sp.]